MCGDGEEPKIWNEQYVIKARKKHKCVECSSVIDVGETYMRVFAVYDDPQTFKFCDLCWSKFGEYRSLLADNECAIGELWETISEYE